MPSIKYVAAGWNPRLRTRLEPKQDSGLRITVEPLQTQDKQVEAQCRRGDQCVTRSCLNRPLIVGERLWLVTEADKKMQIPSLAHLSERD